MSPLHVHAARLAQQLAGLFCGEGNRPQLPEPLDPLAWSGLARTGEAVS